MMQVIESKLTPNQVADRVVALVKMFYTTRQPDMHIGLTVDGNVDYHPNNMRKSSNIAVTLYDTSGGWSLGDWDGDYTEKSSWTPESVQWLTLAFEDWNKEAIQDQDEYAVQLSE